MLSNFVRSWLADWVYSAGDVKLFFSDPDQPCKVIKNADCDPDPTLLTVSDPEPFEIQR